MIVVTGAAGFIGSVLVAKLNKEHQSNLILVDEFSKSEKAKNLENKSFLAKIDREIFFDWLEINHQSVEYIFHIGARSATTEFNVDVLNKLNLHYTQEMWEACSKHSIPLIYASSAATYGMGELGYNDSHEIVEQLQPLNPYGRSKNDFDKWALKQEKTPPFWAGLKYFNVYGPNEYHKGLMASVILHAFNQIKNTGQVKLFKSHHSDYKDGMQLRDFVYVKDVVDIMLFLMKNKVESGIYNVGTGHAQTFLDLANATFYALNLEPNIVFVPTPVNIRDKYQYFTEAKMDKLRSQGYSAKFSTLDEGVKDYVRNYLKNELIY
ncbi:MAG: ADP-glyceromanno-heptose 6-epimerase [Bacteroidales bacterium]|jgi:ADP-L-glycero-D-manno-heptose 6-epimerase|nr:ADP-glyceromanno-heptose 6-epimerase [Bacteroidales bacterium]